MALLTDFWTNYRNEILTTLLAIVCIHLITTAGGFVGKRKGGAKRVEGTGLKQSGDGA